MSHLRIGVLGAAKIAEKSTLPAIVSAGGVDIVSIASRDLDRARMLTERFGGAPRGRYEDVVDDPSIDAVYVPLPIGLHREWVSRALEAGKHVLSEKSLAGGYGDVRYLVDMARDRGLVLFENFMCETHPQSIEVRDLVAQGGIGELAHLSLSFGFPSFAPDDQRNSRALAGGALNDAGAYCADMAVFYSSQLPTSVFATADFRGADVDQWGTAAITLDGGAVAHLSYGFGLDYRNEARLWGQTGRIEVDRAFSIPADRTPSVTVIRNTGPTALSIAPTDQFATQIQRFVETIKAGSGAEELDRRQTHGLLMEAIRESASRGRSVEMSEFPEWDDLASRIRVRHE
ncbi:Gfo/Idh/MocA family oxidoreductase [Microcella daejeonensis]|uniref:Gfo/Idh/MocA family oxidoreductase n=1 Tax=Microcella daejeonensis TaxID=2994971 RepID=A0A9E8SBT1_9MICO|nr:Gfo/Idh/MocA family oxidoreductase [Microcella daejeonensis]WAB81877.1 Gfo/Idh/MocA family oxidoreductase [Microcella daejeonensis]